MPRDGANEDRGSGELPSGGAYQQLFDSFPGAAIITDPGSGTILDANQMACDLLGRSREEMLGLDQSRLHPAQDAETYRALFQDRLPREQAVRGEIGICRPSGEVVRVEASASTLDLAGKRVACTFFLERPELALGRSHDQLLALNAVASTVAGSLNLDEIMDRALDKVLEVMKVEVGVITLLDAQTGEMTLVTHRGLSDEFVDNMRRQKQRVVGQLADTIPAREEAILIQDLRRDPRAAVFGGDFERERLHS
ncbi:MAG: PAS domain-containing protein, partial [Anaerolineae bacterium]|nr:PAS domain-containing protein [Anaerolineae bacterium]